MSAHLIAISAGVLAAVPLLVGLATQGGFVLGLLAPLPLFLVGLYRGWSQVLLAGCVLAGLSTLLAGFGLAIASTVMLVAPACLLVRQAMLSRPAADGSTEWYPSGLLVMWLTLCGVVWLLISMLVFASQGAEPSIELQVRDALTRSLTAVLPAATDTQITGLAREIAPYALGLSVVSWMMLMALNAILAQGLLVRFKRQGRPSPDIADTDLPSWLTLVLAVLAGAAYLVPGTLGFVARNLLLIVLVPYFFAGLAVVHLFCRRFAAKTMMLVGFYFAVVLITWTTPLVACLGLIDQWAGLRRRLSNRDDGQEDG